MLWGYSDKKVNPLIIQQVADLIIKAASRQIDFVQQKQLKKQKKELRIITQRPLSTINITNRLYQQNSYIKRNQQRRLQKLYQEVQNIKDFKVQNEISKKINKKNPSKPIFERAQQILNKREKRITSQKIHMENQADINDKDKYVKSTNKLNINEFNIKQQDFEKKRCSYLNTRRMEELNNTFSKLKSRPDLTNQTEDIIRQNRYADKNILERFEQHDLRKKYYDMVRLKRITESETPFSPNISKKSKLMATRSYSNIGQSVFQRISRNPSTQCLKKGCLQITRQNQTQNAYLQYKSRSKSHRNLNVTFSPPRIPTKQLAKNLAQRSNHSKNTQNSVSKSITSKPTNALSRQKVNLNHVESCKYLKQDSEQQIQNRKLKKIIVGNKDQVIKFVKRLIIKQRIMDSS